LRAFNSVKPFFALGHHLKGRHIRTVPVRFFPRTTTIFRSWPETGDVRLALLPFFHRTLGHVVPRREEFTVSKLTKHEEVVCTVLGGVILLGCVLCEPLLAALSRRSARSFGLSDYEIYK